MNNKTTISIVIVNFRTPQLTVDCLASIHDDLPCEYNFSAIVVDNHSGDESLEIIADAIQQNQWGGWVSVLALEHNGGFAFGNNQALKTLLNAPQPPDYIWLLNPDTVLRKGALRPLAEFLAAHSDAGIVGSRLEDPDGTPQVSAFREHSVVSEFLSGMRWGFLDALLTKWTVAPAPVSPTPHRADWLAGASMMIRRDVFEQVGLLDERYFMYFEEVDFCIRARKAGWKCWYVPASRVVHLVGAASGISETRKKAPRRPRYWFESRRRFFLKNHGRLALLYADFLWMTGYSVWRARRILQRKPDLDPPHFLKDFFTNSVFARGFNSERPKV